jgi:Zn-dependent protease/CBS domain-containing protein
MSGNSLYIGKYLGIPVRVHVSWLLVFALVTTSLGGSYFPQQHASWTPALNWSLAVMTSLLFFISVLLHELAHSVVARRRGLPVHDIVLFVFGGVSELSQEPQTAGTEFTMALVGPATSIVLGLLWGAIWRLSGTISAPLAAVSMYLSGINLSLGLFNLVPGFPLDGGRVLRAILWWRTGNLLRATRWASRAGQFVAYAFIILGVWQALTVSLLSGLWLAFIGWFIDNAAQSSYRQLALQQLLAGHTVGEIMTRSCTAVSPGATLQEVVDRYILATGSRCLPIISDGKLEGLVTVHRIQAFPQETWARHTAREAMIPRAQLRTTTPSTGVAEALQEMSADGVNQLPVIQDGELVGLLTRENVTTFLRLKAELGR